MGDVHLGERTRRRPILTDPAPPRRPAVRRPALKRPWYVRVLDSTKYDMVCRMMVCAIPDMPCMKRVYKDK